MSPEFTYLIKVNIAFIFFYAFYRLFFYKDTFFKLRRFILLIFFLLACVYPLMNFHEWVKEQKPIAEVIMLYSAVLPETVTETVAQEATTDWKQLFSTAAVGIYWLVVGLLLVRFFIQFGSIVWLAWKSKRTVIQHTDVFLLDKPSGPFSFFKLIFLHPASHSEKELDEILTHEKTHVQQWHSIDVMISELICILCWMNPFAWLLKREVRHNLEYLADNTVLKSGYDSKTYQYHLLGLAHQGNLPVGSLSNNFNMQHLKNRISMMNKKRSKAIERSKYLIFIPLIALLMLFSNIEAVARVTKVLSPATPAAEPIQLEPAPEVSTEEINTEEAIVDEPAPTPPPEVRQPEPPVVRDEAPTEPIEPAEEIRPAEEPANDISKQIFTVVEQMPQFPGGDEALLRFINQRIKYPVIAQENGIQGRVICTFVVGDDGNIRDAEVVRGIDPALDQEAIRVIYEMPEWEPGRQRGRPVSVKYTVPITFRLQ